MRRWKFACLVAVLAAAGCSRGWQFESNTSEMTGKTFYVVFRTADETITLPKTALAAEQKLNPWLRIKVSEEGGSAVEFNPGERLEQQLGSSEVMVRFDENPPHSFVVRQEKNYRCQLPNAVCGFRPKPITDSGACRSPIPVEADHRFRSKPIAERMIR